MPHSTQAEPLAATEVLRWLHGHGLRRVAVISDHIALALGQQRPISGNGGFSKAFRLNEFFRVAHAPGNTTHIFFVAGERNPADALSRSNRLGDGQSAVRSDDRVFPGLGGFHHPYAEAKARPWWCW